MESKRRPAPVEGYRVGIGSWDEFEDVEEIGASIHRELAELGHRPAFFRIHDEAPPSCDVLLLHGPRGRFLPVLKHAQRQSPRPRVAIWNTEGLPDLRLPWPLMTGAGNLRRRFASIGTTSHPIGRRIGEAAWFAKLDARLMRFDFLGQYLEAIARGWVDDFFDISDVYARILSRAGIRVTAVPFGSMVGAFEEMGIERDIDVLWIGLRASRRRSRLLDRIRTDLEKRGVRVCVVDGEENPSVFGKERTRLLNRSKITLNLLRTWYDENSMRLCLAAANRSLIVSESLLPHVPDWVPGLNYVAASPARLADAITDHLADDRKRERITDEAFRLVTSTLTFGASIQAIMRQVGEGLSQGGRAIVGEAEKGTTEGA